MKVSLENYLKALVNLQEDSETFVKTTTLSDALGIKPGSVTEMLKRLSEDGLVNYIPYKGASLTDVGRKMGVSVVRHHRIIELFLFKVLGLSWEAVHDEAENLEHAVSDLVIDHMDKVLGFPKYDPHGDPIPQKDGHIPNIKEAVTLNNLKKDQVGQIIRLSCDDKSFLKYITSIGGKIGECIKVTNIYEFDGSKDIVIHHKKHHISDFTAQHIWVIPEHNNKE